MGLDGRKGLFVLAATMGLALVALIYFLFVVHAPEEQRNSSAAKSQASNTPTMPRLAVVPLPPMAADETNLCGYGRIKQDAVEDIRAKARTAADKTFSRLKARLADSGDESESALGLYLQRSTDKLVKLASGSRDPQVYALAFLACGYGTGGACSLLSAEQWADI